MDAPSAGAGQRGAEERRGGRADKAKRTRLRARGVVRRHTPGGLGPRGEGAAGGEGLRRARSRARAGRGVGKGRAGGSVESLRGSSQGRPGGCRGRPRAAGPVFPLGTVRRPPLHPPSPHAAGAARPPLPPGPAGILSRCSSSFSFTLSPHLHPPAEFIHWDWFQMTPSLYIYTNDLIAAA